MATKRTRTLVPGRTLVTGRTPARLARQVELALNGVNLSLPQYRLLALLGEGSAQSSALASRLAVRPPSVTSVVDGLVTRGLVERQPDPGDRRRIGLVLTPSGHATLDEADAVAGAHLLGLAERLDDPAKTEAALAALVLWQEALDAAREERLVRR